MHVAIVDFVLSFSVTRINVRFSSSRRILTSNLFGTTLRDSDMDFEELRLEDLGEEAVEKGDATLEESTPALKSGE